MVFRDSIEWECECIVFHSIPDTYGQSKSYRTELQYFLSTSSWTLSRGKE